MNSAITYGERTMTPEEGHAKALLLGYEYHEKLNLYRRRCADQTRQFTGCAYFEYVDVSDFHVVIERRSELDRPLETLIAKWGGVGE